MPAGVPVARAEAGGVGAGAVIVQFHVFEAEPMAFDTVAVNECDPTLRPLIVTGLVHDDADAPSSEHVWLVAEVAFQLKLTPVDVVDAPGPAVGVIVGAPAAAQLTVVDVEPRSPVAVIVTEWFPLPSPDRLFGDAHALAAPPSTEQDTDVASVDVQAIVATSFAAMVSGGISVTEIVGSPSVPAVAARA